MSEAASHLDKLNADLEGTIAYALLSEGGKKEAFPWGGILGQAKEARDAGVDINATVGVAYEDDGSLMVLPELEEQFLRLGKAAHAYTISFGNPELRNDWRAWISRKNPSLESRMSLPVVTQGITHGLRTVSELFVGQGDVVIGANPYWGNYNKIFGQANLTTHPLLDGEHFNVGGLEAAIAGADSNKVTIVLNDPQNPTGYVLSEDELARAAKVIKQAADEGRDINVICDDAYLGSLFGDRANRESAFATFADLHERVMAVKVDGLTKEYYAWGDRVGFITYAFKGMELKHAEALEDKTAGAIRGMISSSNTAAQLAAVNVLGSESLKGHLKEKYRTLEERFDATKQVLRENEDKYSLFFRPLPFHGGYFMCVELVDSNANDVRERLIHEYKTGVIAIGDNLLRINHAGVNKADIPVLFESIYNACRDLAPRK